MPSPCPDCGLPTLHRSHRPHWQRRVGYVAPLRPYVCIDCGYRGWGLVRGEERRPWLIAGGLLAVVIVGYAGVQLAVMATKPASVEPAAIEQSEAPAALPSPDIADTLVAPGPLKPAKAALDVPEPMQFVAAPADNDAPEPQPDESSQVLSDLTQAWDGEELRIALVADKPVTDARVKLVKSGNRYTIDLPGTWRVGAGIPSSITLQESRAESLRIERKRRYLRVALILRDKGGPPPSLSPTSDGLVIVLR